MAFCFFAVGCLVPVDSPLALLTEGVAWRRASSPLAEADYARFDAVLQVVDVRGAATAAWHKNFRAVQKRQHVAGDADDGNDAKTPPCVITLPSGTSVCRSFWTAKDEPFAQLSSLRQAVVALLAHRPKTLAIDIAIKNAGGDTAAVQALTVALLATAPLSETARKKQAKIKIIIATQTAPAKLKRAAVTAAANTLARRLITLPPNILTPKTFARWASNISRRNGLTVKTHTAAQLRQMGAGAITAVGRAATADNAPMVLKISYRPAATKATAKNEKRRHIALAGKGVCYDTGGVNVKPARYMRGMSKDMAGAAVAFASTVAAAQLRLPVAVDAWLVLADNAIAANAYRPDEVITALNGKSIEVVHTDAEGRMLLADTLTLASRALPRPELLVSYATLTGTMHIALGERMSGFFATSVGWQKRAAAAAAASGERLCNFPLPSDYKKALESPVADIKQCSEDSLADHILAALFLREFIDGKDENKSDWLHLDLSSAMCKGGLGAVASDINGFGVAWTLALLARAD